MGIEDGVRFEQRERSSRLARAERPQAVANQARFVAGNVYFNTGEGKLYKVPKYGGPTQLLFDGLGNEPTALATDGTNVASANLLAGRVMKVPVGGGGASTLVGGVGWPSAIAAGRHQRLHRR